MNDRGRAGLFVDFDGTLAAIVDDPARARPLPGIREPLEALAAQCALVAVVSGRPVRFLLDHVRIPHVVLSGLYGLEAARDGALTEHADAAHWRAVVSAVADRAEREAPPGVGVERKGLSATLHFRLAPDLGDWAASWASAAASSSGLSVLPGRQAVELRPPVVADKGTVVTELAAGLAAACFIGDDRGDLDAFIALDRLRADAGVVAVKVAVDSDEAPPSLVAAADVTVRGPDGVEQLLRSLAAA